jgi:histidyl-tRNA synthetase
MLLIGFKDLTANNMIQILNGRKLQIEKKIIPEFLGKEWKSSKTTKPELIKLEFSPDTLSGNLFKKSVLLTLICFAIRKRAFLKIELLQELVERLNNYKNGVEFEKELDLGSILDFLGEEESVGLFAESVEEINKAATSLLNFYLLELFSKLNIVESCVFLEKNGLGYNFMSEIEKGNYENRKIAKCLNLYRNFFKTTTSGKKSPDNDFIAEMFMTLQLSENRQNYKNFVVSLFSYEGKPYLQNKLISESVHLSNFFKLSGHIVLKNILVQLEMIETEKNKRKNKPGELGGPTDCLTQLCWHNLERIHGDLRANLLEWEETKKKNPKAKQKMSASWEILAERLCAGEEFVSLRTRLTDSLAELGDAVNEALAPHVDTSKKPKLPKGTRDYTPLQMNIKSKALNIIKDVFRKHGAFEIDTPVFELKETLMGKYGEEGGKLIYDLEDQGGELLSLRYDLTVPFARYMGMNSVSELKRFHIGKVYRRDQPNINKGRFREFYQCDFDNCGKTDDLLADAEVLKIMCEIYSKFGLDFQVKISHRLLLEAIIECSDCDLRKFNTICSSIDKLDKEPWEAVANELVSEKGLSSLQVNNLKKFVLHNGKISDLLEIFEKEQTFGTNQKAQKALKEMKQLEKNLKLLKVEGWINFNLSLARGLDYYTGLIFEAVLLGESGIGSVGGGGRYDGLIGMFSKNPIPSVGMSIGIERLFMILEKNMKDSTRQGYTEIFVATIGKNLNEEKLKLLNLLWENEFKAEASYASNPKPDKQLKKALENKIPFMIWIGESEVKENCVNVKNMYLKKEHKIKNDELIAFLKNEVNNYYIDLEEGKVCFNK